MFNIIHGIVNSQRSEERRAQKYRALIRNEAKMGGELFGTLPRGGRREFFCLNEHIWVWHEEWDDLQGNHQAITTRYEVRPNGVLKAQDGQPYNYVTLEEAQHLYKAVKMYNERVQSVL